MPQTDLRILALANSKTLPEPIQHVFDHWRIWKARDAVAALVRKRAGQIDTLKLYLERLEAADTEETIIQGLYAISEAVEVHRAKTGLHRDYIILIMSQHLNPWGVLEFQHDFENPMPYLVEAADRLWALCRAEKLNVRLLLSGIKDPLLTELHNFYKGVPPQ